MGAMGGGGGGAGPPLGGGGGGGGPPRPPGGGGGGGGGGIGPLESFLKHETVNGKQKQQGPSGRVPSLLH